LGGRQLDQSGVAGAGDFAEAAAFFNITGPARRGGIEDFLEWENEVHAGKMLKSETLRR
jgi:hypothetical protein